MAARRGLKHLKRHSATRRWGHVHEIDRRLHVGTRNWMGLPLRLQHLSAWRAMHLFPGGKSAHAPVRRYARKHKVGFSSDLPVLGRTAHPLISHPSKVAYVFKRLGKMK